MDLKGKEIAALKDLQSQEKTCIEKYTRYQEQAKDSILKELFQKLAKKEQKHYDSLEQVISGQVPDCDCNDTDGRDYNPTPTYTASDNSEAKKSDCFLATDCIATEKLVSGEYNTDVFVFANAAIRKLLADIQIEEQNHAEMLYKYKTVNCMA